MSRFLFIHYIKNQDKVRLLHLKMPLRIQLEQSEKDTIKLKIYIYEQLTGKKCTEEQLELLSKEAELYANIEEESQNMNLELTVTENAAETNVKSAVLEEALARENLLPQGELSTNLNKVWLYL